LEIMKQSKIEKQWNFHFVSFSVRIAPSSFY